MSTECLNREKNLSSCNCTYEPCSRKGLCCQCLTYHRQRNELPACYFDRAAEATYDRSVSNFVRLRQKKEPK